MEYFNRLGKIEAYQFHFKKSKINNTNVTLNNEMPKVYFMR